MQNRILVVLIGLSFCIVRHAASQSLPSNFETIINLPSAANGNQFNGTIQSDTQVNLWDGGDLSGHAGNEDGTSSDVEVNVYGGLVHSNFQAWTGSTINLLGGRIGAGLHLHDGSRLNISSGVLAEIFRGQAGSYLEISGGRIERNSVTEGTALVTGGNVYLSAWHGGIVDYTGGTYLGAVALDGGTANVHGGLIGPKSGVDVNGILNIHGGVIRDDFSLRHGVLSLFGGEFRLNGDLISGIEGIGDVASIELGEDNILSGTLSDGNPFVLTRFNSNRFGSVPVHLTSTAVPLADPAVFIASEISVPHGIRNGQTLIVDNGASVTTDLDLGWGSTLVVEAGGTITQPFNQPIDAVHSHVDIAGGTLSSLSIYEGSRLKIRENSSVSHVLADGESRVEVLGGTISGMIVVDGAHMNVSGGEIGSIRLKNASGKFAGGNAPRVYVDDDSFELTGGTVGQLEVQSFGEVNVVGGAIDGAISLFSNGALRVRGGQLKGSIIGASGSRIDIFGSQFILDGVDITSSLTLHSPYIVPERDVILTARLEDGSMFEYELSAYRDRNRPNQFHPNSLLRLVRVQAVPEPSTVFILIGVIVSSRLIGGRPL